jgi:SAM-dependent methyltransferase
MPALETLTCRVRDAHLLVRSADEWDALSEELFRAYDGKDDERIDLLAGPFLTSWRAVTRNLLADTLKSAGLTTSPPAHPWGLATLERNGLRCEPLLCAVEDLPDPLGAAAVYGGLHLLSFDDVMAGYQACLAQLLRPSLTDSATEWDRRYAGEARVWSAEPNVWVAQELNGIPPGRALDLGAGEGRHAVWLAKRGWRVTAVDFSAVGLGRGQHSAQALGVEDRIEWRVEDATLFAPEPRSLDLALVAYLQLPAKSLRAALASAASGLRPGGRLLLVSHDASNPARGTGGPQDPSVLQKPDQVAALLSASGLRVVSAETRPRPVPGSMRPALDCVVMAEAPSAEA